MRRPEAPTLACALPIKRWFQVVPLWRQLCGFAVALVKQAVNAFLLLHFQPVVPQVHGIGVVRSSDRQIVSPDSPSCFFSYPLLPSAVVAVCFIMASPIISPPLPVSYVFPCLCGFLQLAAAPLRRCQFFVVFIDDIVPPHFWLFPCQLESLDLSARVGHILLHSSCSSCCMLGTGACSPDLLLV